MHAVKTLASEWGCCDRFQVKKKHFFLNVVAIMLSGVVVVFYFFAIISAGCSFVFPKLGLGKLFIQDYLARGGGTIFSATDSVCTLQVLSQDDTPLLYSLVFGGFVNNATSVVLFRAVQKLTFDDFTGMEVLQMSGSFLYFFFCSTVLGIATGLLSAYIIKTLYFARHSTDREIAIMTLMAYLSYILAELLFLSGILTVFFCGIVMSHYTWHNVTESSRVTTNVGPSFGLFSKLLVFLLVGRAACVFYYSALYNYMWKSANTKISVHQQIIIWRAGLMRGAVCIALAFNQISVSSLKLRVVLYFCEYLTLLMTFVNT
ncbi:hypothetical protein CY35_01G167000 [Sphagnum magellanicum]|nr:hypothetical protein CY35_01G167000 [Sphagnum magellanicum]